MWKILPEWHKRVILLYIGERAISLGKEYNVNPLPQQDIS
jgi:hypothetical protein